MLRRSLSISTAVLFLSTSSYAGFFSNVACMTQSLGAVVKDTINPHAGPKVMKLLPLPEGSDVHPTDPYDVVGAMPTGKWKGQPIDTSLKRPAQIVWEDDKQLLIANFRDGKQFHQAHIQKDGVEAVYFRINRFPGPVGVTPAHTLLYFKMKHGSEVILEGEGNTQDLSHPHAVSDFVVSTDFAAPKHVPQIRR